MSKFQYEQQPDAPAQISADLLARMRQAEQALAGEKTAAEEPQVDISAESVAFDTVLKSVSSGRPSDPLPEAFVDTAREEVPGKGPRDRNLSSIIGMIRDEGPAGEAELADDVLELGDGQEGASQEPPEKAPVPEAEPAATTAPAGRRGNPLVNMLVIALLLTVAGLAFLTHQQMQRQEQLEARVKAAQQLVSLLDERYRALEERTSAAPAADLVRRSELRQALAAQQRRFADELLLYAAALAGPVAAGEGSQAPEPAAEAVPAASGGQEEAPAKTGAVVKKQKKTEKTEQAAPPPAAGAAGGGWVVYLRSFGGRSKAEKALAGYAGKVPAMVLLEGRVKGRTVYRLAVTGFASRKEALAYRARARLELGFRDAWIGRG